MANIQQYGAIPGNGAGPPNYVLLARLGECDHRIRNNLQIIASALALQARESADEQVQDALLTAGRRVSAVARVHEWLQAADGDDRVEAAGLLSGLCEDLRQSLGRPRSLCITLDAQRGDLSNQTAVALVLVVNELVTNAVKHAYAGQGGEIRVRLRRESGGWRLTVADDGRGLPEDLWTEPGGGGLRLLALLMRQLGGQLSADPVPNGASLSVRFA